MCVWVCHLMRVTTVKSLNFILSYCTESNHTMWRAVVIKVSLSLSLSITASLYSSTAIADADMTHLPLENRSVSFFWVRPQQTRVTTRGFPCPLGLRDATCSMQLLHNWVWVGASEKDCGKINIHTNTRCSKCSVIIMNHNCSVVASPIRGSGVMGVLCSTMLYPTKDAWDTLERVSDTRHHHFNHVDPLRLCLISLCHNLHPLTGWPTVCVCVCVSAQPSFGMCYI